MDTPFDKMARRVLSDGSEFIGKTPDEIPVEQHLADIVNWLSEIYDVLRDIREDIQASREAIEKAVD